jgi:1-phosphofructokinase
VTVPGFAPGEVNRAEADHRRPAGKGVNVAAALAAYGIPVAATGFLGRDNAALFESFFAERGIADHFVRISGETRTGIKGGDPGTRETTDINFPGAASTAAELGELRERLMALAERDSWVVLTGSLPPGVPASFYRDLVGPLRAAGCRVVADASGEVLRHAVEAAPDVIKPNVHELAALDRRAARHRGRGAGRGPRAGRRWRGPRRRLARRGGRRVHGARTRRDRPPPAHPHSTVGAGDAMVAGIVAARLASLDLADTARLATAFSVHALSGEDICGAAERVEVRGLP